MKKLIVVVMLVLGLNIMTVSATDPIQPSIKIVIDDCENLESFDDLVYDIFVVPYDVNNVNLRPGFSLDEAEYDYEKEGFYSHRAYHRQDNLVDNPEEVNCGVLFYVNINPEDEFYLVIYNEETNDVIYDMKHTFNEISYNTEHRYYRWFVYHYDDNVMTIGEREEETQEPFPSPSGNNELISYLLLGLGALLSIVSSILLMMFLLKKHFKDTLKDKFYLMNITLTILYLVAYLLGVILNPLMWSLLWVLGVYIISVVVFILVSRYNGLWVKVLHVLGVLAIPFVIQVILVIIFDWWIISINLVV